MKRWRGEEVNRWTGDQVNRGTGEQVNRWISLRLWEWEHNDANAALTPTIVKILSSFPSFILSKHIVCMELVQWLSRWKLLDAPVPIACACTCSTLHLCVEPPPLLLLANQPFSSSVRQQHIIGTPRGQEKSGSTVQIFLFFNFYLLNLARSLVVSSNIFWFISFA